MNSTCNFSLDKVLITLLLVLLQHLCEGFMFLHCTSFLPPMADVSYGSIHWTTVRPPLEGVGGWVYKLLAVRGPGLHTIDGTS